MPRLGITITEHKIPSAILPAPRKTWIHRIRFDESNGRKSNGQQKKSILLSPFCCPTRFSKTTRKLDSVRRLDAALAAAGHDIHLHEYHGGHDPACSGVGDELKR